MASSVASVYVKKIYTEEEIRDKLRDYIFVPKDQYKNLRFNSHVRYYKSDGSFNGGGYINLTAKEGKDEGKTYMQLKSNIYNAKKGISWMVDYDNIDKLYVQASPDLLEYKKYCRALEDYMRDGFGKIGTYLGKLDKRIKRLESYVANNGGDNMSTITGGMTNVSQDLKCMPVQQASYP